MSDETRKASRIPGITTYKAPGESLVKIDQGNVANSQLFLPATDDPSTYDEWGNLFNTLTFPQLTASLRELKSFLDEWKVLGDASILKSNSSEYSIINNNLKTIGVKVGYSNLTTVDTSKLFVHGFNKEGRPADVNAFLFLNDDSTETANVYNPINATGTDGAIVKERAVITKTVLGPINNSFVNQLTVLIIEGNAGVYTPKLISIPRDQINELDTTYNFNAWSKATDSLSSATSIATDLKYPSAPTNYGTLYDATTGSAYTPYKTETNNIVSRTTTGWSPTTRTTTDPATVNNYSIKTRLTKDIYVLGICDTALVSSQVVFNNFTMFPTPVSFLSFLLMFENDKAFLDFRIKDFKDKESLFKKTQDEIQNRILDANKIKGEIDRAVRPFTLKKQNEAGTVLLVLEYFNNTANAVVQSSFKNDVLDNAAAYPVGLATRKRFVSATLLADDLDEVWYHGKSSAKLLRLGISGSTSVTASELLSGLKINGDLLVSKDTAIHGALSVAGPSSFARNVTLAGDLAINGGDLTSSNSIFNLLNQSLTIAAFGAAETLNIGAKTASQTIGLGNGATVSGATKTINLGTYGLSGSTTRIIIGSVFGDSAINLIGSNTNTGSLNVTGTTTLNSTLDVVGLVTLTDDLFVNGGDFSTTATTFNLLDTIATTINAFGEATVVTFGYDGTTTASTTNINSGALISGLIKTINFGTGGLAGSINNINLGSEVTGALGTITANQAIIANKTLLVAGLVTLNSDLFVNGGDLKTTAITFNLVNDTAKTINAFGVAEILNLANETINNQAVSIAGGATLSGNTKTINIGKSGVAGSTTNITIGSGLGAGTITLDQITKIMKNLFVTGITTFTGDVNTTGATTLTGTTAHVGNTTTSGTTTLTGLLTANGGLSATAGAFSDTLSVAGATVLNATLSVTGNVSFASDLAVNGGDLTSTASTFNLLQESSVINAFGSASNIHLNDTTATASHWYSSGATLSGSTKTLFFGTNGSVGSTTIINLGSTLGTSTINTFGSAIHTGSKTISATLSVFGATTLNGLFTAAASVVLGDSTADTLTVNATANFIAPVTVATLANTIGTIGDLTVNTNLWSKGANVFDQLIYAKSDITTDANLIATGEVIAEKLKERYLATGIEKYLGDIYQAKYEGSTGVPAINLPKETILWITKGATAYGNIGYLEPLNYVNGSYNAGTKIYSGSEYNFGISFANDYLRFLNDSFINYPALPVGTKTDFTFYLNFNDSVGQTTADTTYEFLSFANVSESLKIGFKTNVANDNLTLVVKRNDIELFDTVTVWPATTGAKVAGEIFRDKTIKNRSVSFNLYKEILSVIVGSEIVASYAFPAVTNDLTTLKLGKTTGLSLKHSLKSLTLSKFSTTEWSNFTADWIPNTTFNQIAQSSEGKFFYNRQPDYIEIKSGKVYASGFNSNNIYSGYNTFNGSTAFVGSVTIENGITGNVSVSGNIVANTIASLDTIKSSRLILRDDSLEEFLTPSDNAKLSVNYFGYNSGTSYFRDFVVYDGKQAQLLFVSGSTKISTFSGQVVATDFVSTKATGTAPLIVSSTTKVDNLNADLLDGLHGSVAATLNTYVARGASLANIQVTGRSSVLGSTNGAMTGGVNVLTGNSTNATWLISGTSDGAYKGGLQLSDSGSEIRLYALTGWLDLNSAGVVTASGGFSGTLTGNASTATVLQTTRTIAISGDGTGTATSFNGSADITIPFTLANTGVTTGTYKSVTVDTKGRVTVGTNPTTLGGYGITDAAPSSHVGTNGTAHAIVTTSVNGFMSAVDKINLDKVPLLGQGLRNSFLCDGGQLNWGITANVFSWSKAYNIYPAQGTLLLNGLPFKKLTIAASSVTLPSAGQCAYITVPTAYSDAPNLVGTCTMSVADATTVSGTDKIILYVRDADSCLQGGDGWIVYGTTVQAGGKRDAYVDNLYTAASDFIVGVGSRTFAKKTLAETRAILGTNANTVSTLVLRDANGDFVARNITATSFIGNASSATVLQTTRTIAISGDGTGTATSFNGSADITIPFTLANTGVTTGTYKSVTVDTKGRVTVGTNPTTLGGYGITDALGFVVSSDTSPDALVLKGVYFIADADKSFVTVNSSRITGTETTSVTQTKVPTEGISKPCWRKGTGNPIVWGNWEFLGGFDGKGKADIVYNESLNSIDFTIIT